MRNLNSCRMLKERRKIAKKGRKGLTRLIKLMQNKYLHQLAASEMLKMRIAEHSDTKNKSKHFINTKWRTLLVKFKDNLEVKK